jgi:hypothetical protein
VKPDNLTELGARELALKIKKFWAARGYSVRLRVEQIDPAKGRGTMFVVRSDIVDGHPRRHLKKRVPATDKQQKSVPVTNKQQAA